MHTLVALNRYLRGARRDPEAKYAGGSNPARISLRGGSPRDRGRMQPWVCTTNLRKSRTDTAKRSESRPHEQRLRSAGPSQLG